MTATGTVTRRSTAGRWVIAATVAGSGMAFLDSTVVNVALPAIGEGLDATTQQLQWVATGYLIALASLILVGGAIGDRFGRRRAFLAGAAAFSATSLLCAVAPGVWWLIGCRVLQGGAAAVLTPNSLALIQSAIRPEDRPGAIGRWSGLTGVASAIGPLVGGYLVGAVSWRGIFVLNLPLGVFVVLAGRRHLPADEATDDLAGLDIAGAALAVVGFAAITAALIGIGGSTIGRALFVALAAGAVIEFIRRERRSASPMLPLELFDSRAFTSSNVITALVYTATGGFFFLFASFLQIALGYTPLAAGAASLPVTLAMLTLSPAAGRLVQRFGPRVPLTAGPLVIAIGLLWLTTIQPDARYAPDVLPAVIVFAIGLTTFVAPITVTVLAAAGDRHAGVASGFNSAAARAGGLVAAAGLPVLAGIQGAGFYDPAIMTAGFHTAMTACALVAAAAAALAAIAFSASAATTTSTRRLRAPAGCPVAAPGVACKAAD
jgi:EmrB/QacA subfamily drug resistance transporter